jgi:O-antigen/teichoic acid export membrane protein
MIATATMHGRWPKPVNWRMPSRIDIRQSAGYAMLNITAAGPAELDKTLAAQLLPLAFAGVYAAGARVIGAATLPVIAMMLSALPRLFREGQGHTRRTAQLLQWLFAAALGYSTLLAAAFWFIAPVFDSLFGAKYHGLDQTIRWLCLAIPGMALRIAAGSVLMALGKPWVRVSFELAGLIVLIVASTLLTAGFGAHGMPLALACSEWAMSLFGWRLVVTNRKKGCIG